MSLKSQIETAKDAVSKALITALEEKNENCISDLFTVYNKLNTISTQTKISIDSNKFTISGNSIPVASYNDNYINFGATAPVNLNGSMGSDVISFS